MEIFPEEHDGEIVFQSCPVMNFENGQREPCISNGLMLRVLFDYQRTSRDSNS